MKSLKDEIRALQVRIAISYYGFEKKYIIGLFCYILYEGTSYGQEVLIILHKSNFNSRI